jgi:hypothetical protein
MAAEPHQVEQKECNIVENMVNLVARPALYERLLAVTL